jgi:hypothetical protein
VFTPIPASFVKIQVVQLILSIWRESAQIVFNLTSWSDGLR